MVCHPTSSARALGWLEGASVEVSCWTPYSLGADGTEARDRIRGRVAGALMNANPEWFDGLERRAVERLQAEYDVGHHAASAAGHGAIVPDSLVDRYAIAGTAEDVTARLRQLLDTPGVHRVILNPQIVGPGAKPLELSCESSNATSCRVFSHGPSYPTRSRVPSGTHAARLRLTGNLRRQRLSIRQTE